MLTKKQIIDDTAQYFNVNNRATNGGGCEYFDCEGYKCAIGRYLNDELNQYGYFVDAIHNSLTDWNQPMISVKGKTNSMPLDNVIKLEYVGHEYKFWSDLQGFHDNNSYWDDTGLTELGQLRYQGLLKEWADE
jgi:hypothetical protein